MIRKAHQRRFIDRLMRFLAWAVFIVYAAFLARRLFFHAYGGYARTVGSQPEPNYRLFHTINNYVLNYDHYDFSIWFLNLFGNVAAFMPLGFLLPLMADRVRSVWKTGWIAAIASLCVEVLQMEMRVGSFDVDDILLNTVGGVLGYVILKMVINPAYR